VLILVVSWDIFSEVQVDFIEVGLTLLHDHSLDVGLANSVLLEYLVVLCLRFALPLLELVGERRRSLFFKLDGL